MDMFDLTGKVALVTGGTSGIGFGMAKGLLAAGALVALVGRQQSKGEKALAALNAGDKAIFMAADVSDTARCRALVPEVVRHFGGLDILINNAGTNIGKPPQDLSLEEWTTVMDINLTPAFVLSQAAYPELKRRGGGKIINTGSMATLFGSAMAAAYCASKGGIGQLTKALAVAWGRDNIQVNAILPGYIDTELTQAIRANPGFEERLLARTPLGRLGTPDDCSGIAVFLASAASNFISGALIPLDGGYASQL
jgi:2-deoxy-D-gluconate 3-dehydrogenase